jgi:3-phosphoshikimate 1-carboxyvinyltransferase
LRHFGVDLKIERDDAKDADELTRRIARQMRAAGKQEPVTRLRLPSGARVRGAALSLPGDVGEAAVAALAATLIPGSDVLLENVLLNPGRAGFFSALRRMGADLEVVQRRERAGEAFGTLRVRSSGLFGKRFDAESLADMREEVFLLLVAAAFAEGESVFRDLDFLRGGEPDRLKSLVAALKQAGVDMGELEDGLVLRGKGEMDGGTYDALGHPGLAAAYAVLALKSHGASTLRGAQGLEWRYPGLLAKLEAAAEKPGAEKPA